MLLDPADICHDIASLATALHSLPECDANHQSEAAQALTKATDLAQAALGPDDVLTRHLLAVGDVLVPPGEQ